ncbi:Leucyl/phenylalanyl-tRNA--protein transferase [Marinobacterium lacunae]|uniref:Leucyl/phenylalanyl-tRNA--protein transferase n=1 Tax=Marinobacterium lacunae TaxID=1232683 RepID=A0A081FZC8_9GAMM|nr:leucyl/phenylalanyl-tRNA--protein transferase [Marinobacterium lacunae]KEA63883.1 Leucyl/phenylalanyl-tRNA--protein transferase [Marinobacterium lacunae]MBR9884651.1 leucyl/phenylalanyl-tRNA--protein transferase [Oceanospirillales bacterium]
MIPWLHPARLEFPPVHTALEEPNGLLAAGGDLRPDRILAAYRNGIFPWFNDDEPILWWSPDPRCVLIPSELHISRSLRKTLRKQHYSVTFDTAFAEVIAACAAPRTYSAGTWISPRMQNAYLELHRLGHGHSVEVWMEDQLVGGLYGLAIGGVFFGESMFSTRTDASKIAFAHLVEHLKNWGYALIDCQVYNDHLASLGAREIPRPTFIAQLNKLLQLQPEHEWRASHCFQHEGSAS